jgi:DNA invertase Pin-like site-specific DNA recombinase
LVGPFEDDVSGAAGLERRQGLVEALGLLGKGDVLLVAKRDRLGRDPILVAMVEAACKRKGARVVSAAGEGTEGDTPTDVLMRRIVDAFAEYERLVIKARTRAALQAKISRRERVGKVRFGFRLSDDGRTLLPAPEEQEALSLIRKLRDEGESLRDIAAELTRRGIETKEGLSKWTHTAIARILARAA